MTIDPTTSPAEDLLQALTVGDLRSDAPAVAARLRAEPALQARWQELAATIADLQVLAPSQASDARPDDTHRAAVAAVQSFRAAAGPRRWRIGAALAAAALAACMLFWSLQPASGPAPDPRLGGGEAGTTMTPNGAWVDGQPFSWPSVPGAIGYRVQVRSAPDGVVQVLPDPARGEDVFAQPSWRPAAAECSQLPVRFEWRALAVDGSGQVIGTSPWAVAQR